jgi:hypothetical protein
MRLGRLCRSVHTLLVVHLEKKENIVLDNIKIDVFDNIEKFLRSLNVFLFNIRNHFKISLPFCSIKLFIKVPQQILKILLKHAIFHQKR